MEADLETDVFNILSQYEIDSGWSIGDIAARLRRDESDVSEALRRLERSGRAHEDQGRWHAGPAPGAPTVDQQ
jgi:DNA-binding MarR family transcriptional regulator